VEQGDGDINVGRRRCGRRSARVAGRPSAVVLTVRVGPKLLLADASGDKATTGRNEAGTQLRAVDLSNLPPTPAVEDGKSGVRRNSTTIGSAARLGGQMDGD
jgi:hypothetical protein